MHSSSLYTLYTCTYKAYMHTVYVNLSTFNVAHFVSGCETANDPVLSLLLSVLKLPLLVSPLPVCTGVDVLVGVACIGVALTGVLVGVAVAGVVVALVGMSAFFEPFDSTIVLSVDEEEEEEEEEEVEPILLEGVLLYAAAASWNKCSDPLSSDIVFEEVVRGGLPDTGLGWNENLFLAVVDAAVLVVIPVEVWSIELTRPLGTSELSTFFPNKYMH